jgi:uncharacterized membrane protein
MSGKTVKYGLVVSLAFNIFLLGAIAGGAYRWFAAGGSLEKAPPAERTALRFAADDLSSDRQQQFLSLLRAARRAGKPYIEEGRDGRRQVLTLLGAPTLDRQALDAALAATRDADLAQRVAVETAVVDFAAALTPQERAQFAASLRLRGEWRDPQAVAAARSAVGAASNGSAASATQP